MEHDGLTKYGHEQLTQPWDTNCDTTRKNPTLQLTPDRTDVAFCARICQYNEKEVSGSIQIGTAPNVTIVHNVTLPRNGCANLPSNFVKKIMDCYPHPNVQHIIYNPEECVNNSLFHVLYVVKTAACTNTTVSLLAIQSSNGTM